MMLQDKAAVIYGAAGGMRDYQVPRQDLPKLAQGSAERPKAKANPRPEPPDVVLDLLEEMW
jgi:hypothetical protein